MSGRAHAARSATERALLPQRTAHRVARTHPPPPLAHSRHHGREREHERGGEHGNEHGREREYEHERGREHEHERGGDHGRHDSHHGSHHGGHHGSHHGSHHGGHRAHFGGGFGYDEGRETLAFVSLFAGDSCGAYAAATLAAAPGVCTPLQGTDKFFLVDWCVQRARARARAARSARRPPHPPPPTLLRAPIPPNSSPSVMPTFFDADGGDVSTYDVPVSHYGSVMPIAAPFSGAPTPDSYYAAGAAPAAPSTADAAPLAGGYGASMHDFYRAASRRPSEPAVIRLCNDAHCTRCKQVVVTATQTCTALRPANYFEAASTVALAPAPASDGAPPPYGTPAEGPGACARWESKYKCSSWPAGCDGGADGDAAHCRCSDWAPVRVCAEPGFYAGASSHSAGGVGGGSEGMPYGRRLSNDGSEKDCPATAGRRLDDKKCSNCPAGYSPSGSNKCKPCGKGEYSDTGADSCTKCGEGQSSDVGSDSCTDCDKGSYKKGGDGGECVLCGEGQSSEKRSGSCKDCPKGTFKTGSGGDCTPCSKCTLQQTTLTDCSATADTTCTGDCQLVYGGFCSSGSFDGNGGCTGTCSICDVNASPNADKDKCVCHAGYSQSGNSCTKCNAGSSSIAGAATCTPCTAGTTYAASAGSSSCTACTVCTGNTVPTKPCTSTSNAVCDASPTTCSTTSDCTSGKACCSGKCTTPSTDAKNCGP